MAVSAETQAIIDTLKAEGDLIRNSGTNSVRSVKIQMDRFEGLFTSINNNLIQQTSILTSQLSAAEQAARQAETRRQYEELEPPGGTTNTTPVGRDAIEQRISNSIDSKLKDFSMLGAIKSLALGAAGAFVGYNLLKGFIDEATGGGFTKFEGGIANLGKQLSEIDLPNITSTMSELQASVAGLTTTLNQIKDTIESIDLGDILKKLGYALLGLNTLVLAWKLRTNERIKANTKKLEETEKRIDDKLKKYEDYLDGKMSQSPDNPMTDLPNQLPGGDGVDDLPNRLGSTDSDLPNRGNPQRPQQSSVGNGYRPDTKTVTGPDRLKGFFGFPQDFDIQDPANRGMLRQDFMDKFGAAQGYTQTEKGVVRGPNGQFTADQDLLDEMSKTMDAKYSKYFKNVVKGFALIGIVFSAYELYVIYLIFQDPRSTDKQKRQAIAGFAGGFVGAAALGTAGALMGAPFGGWTGLITGGIGALVGGFAGSLVAEYIVEWAFENEPTPAQIEANERAKLEYYEKMAGMTTQEAINFFANSHSVGGDPLTRFMDPSYNNSYNPRTGYESGMDRQNMITPRLDFQQSPRRGYESGMDAMNELPRYLQGASYIPGGGSRTALLQRASAGGGMMGNVIINAPQNVSPVVNNVEGGKSISHVQVANFGGGGGFGMGRDDPYNLSFV